MKIYATIIGILIAGLSVQCVNISQETIKDNGEINTVQRNLNDYDAIEISGSIKTKLTTGKEGSLTITASENILPYIITEVEDNKLKVHLQDDYNFRIRHKMLVEIPVESISKLNLRGSGEISSTSKLTGKNLQLTLKGSGDMLLNIDTQELHTNLKGSGDMELSLNIQNFYINSKGSGDLDLEGFANNLQADLKGSGDLKAANLKVKKADMNLKGSGNAKIFVENEVDVAIKGSGDVTILGNPKTQRTSTKGSGDIHFK